MPSPSIKIKFIGGPFDGHCQPFTEPPLLKRLALPVTENTLLLLQGKRLGPPTEIASVARYELREVDGGGEYRFVETVSAKDIDLEGMLKAAQEIGDATKRGRKKQDLR